MTEVENSKRMHSDSEKKYQELKNTSSTTINDLEEKLVEAMKKRLMQKRSSLSAT